MPVPGRPSCSTTSDSESIPSAATAAGSAPRPVPRGPSVTDLVRPVIGSAASLWPMPPARLSSRSGIPVSCLASIALGLRALLALRAEGVTRLVLSHGDCDACPRGGVARIGAHLETVRRMLESRGLAGFQVVALGADPWRRALAAAVRQPRPALDRRAFFRQAIGAAVDEVTRRADPKRRGRRPQAPPAGRYFPATAPEHLVAFAPVIDPATCTGCDACARLCPSGAIRLVGRDARGRCRVPGLSHRSRCLHRVRRLHGRL